jgi:hypothetical protein
MLIVDDLSDSRFERFLAQVPGRASGEFAVGQTRNLSHLRQPKVARLGEDCGVQVG